MEYVALFVKYDPSVVSHDFLASTLFDVEGVENVRIEEGN